MADAALLSVKELGYDIPSVPLRFSDGMEIQRVTKIEGAEMLTLDFLLAAGWLEGILERRIRIETLDGKFAVVGREDLIRMKAAAGRPQDVADIQRLRDLDR